MWEMKKHPQKIPDDGWGLSASQCNSPCSLVSYTMETSLMSLWIGRKDTGPRPLRILKPPRPCPGAIKNGTEVLIAPWHLCMRTWTPDHLSSDSLVWTWVPEELASLGLITTISDKEPQVVFTVWKLFISFICGHQSQFFSPDTVQGTHHSIFLYCQSRGTALAGSTNPTT